jgi:hypothetical protein
MSDLSTFDNINSYSVLCNGCGATQPLLLFLHPVDPSCYRVRVQCTRCIAKSVKHWRAHREDITAARATRERDRGRIICECGTSISARYRAQHCKSKRHLSVVAVLRQHNALPVGTSSSTHPPPAMAVQPASHTADEEFDALLAAAERDLAARDALLEQYRSQPRPPYRLPLRVSPTPATALTVDGLAGEHR